MGPQSGGYHSELVVRVQVDFCGDCRTPPPEKKAASRLVCNGHASLAAGSAPRGRCLRRGVCPTASMRPMPSAFCGRSWRGRSRRTRPGRLLLPSWWWSPRSAFLRPSSCSRPLCKGVGRCRQRRGSPHSFFVTGSVYRERRPKLSIYITAFWFFFRLAISNVTPEDVTTTTGAARRF